MFESQRERISSVGGQGLRQAAPVDTRPLIEPSFDSVDRESDKTKVSGTLRNMGSQGVQKVCMRGFVEGGAPRRISLQPAGEHT